MAKTELRERGIGERESVAGEGGLGRKGRVCNDINRANTNLQTGTPWSTGAQTFPALQLLISQQSLGRIKDQTG